MRTIASLVSTLSLLSLALTSLGAGCTASAGSGGAGGAASATVADGSGATTGGAGGTGGGSGRDHGAPSDTYPAFHPTPPELVKLDGHVLATPKLVPVYFGNDDPTLTAQVTAFASGLGASSYWAANASEYGVGPIEHLGTVQLAESPATTLDDADIQTWLRGKLESGDPAFPAPDGNTIYMIVYPKGVAITEGGGTACHEFGAYHQSLTLDAAHGGVLVPYAVMPRCDSFAGFSGLDMVTAGASHELLEAVTDPEPEANPAYEMMDEDHAFWMMAVGAENGDMCSGSHGAYFKPADLGFTVQRCWSNVAAAALHDPCVPSIGGAPYFNTAAVLPDVHTTTAFGPTTHSHVISIPVGETRSVELDLFSDAPTSGPWNVDVYDLASLYGGPKELTITLDRHTGVNGEKIWADITAVKKASPFYGGFSLFVIRSTLGAAQSTWVGAVANP